MPAPVLELAASGARARLSGEVDGGALRVAWATAQIVQSVTWNIDVAFPSPFAQAASALSVFSFDFLSLECVFDDANHFQTVKAKRSTFAQLKP